MLKRPLVPLVLAMLALTGCASAPQTEAADQSEKPTPTVTTSPNKVACENFADIVLTIPSRLSNEATAADKYESLKVDFDTVALTASGVVQERMLALVEEWPDALDVVVWKKTDELNSHFSAIGRACAADGVDREIAQLDAS